MGRQKKFQMGDWAQLNKKAPKIVREDVGNFAVGEVVDYQRHWEEGEYKVKFNNGKTYSILPAGLDKATASNNSVEATIEKLERQREEIEHRLKEEEGKLLFMRSMGMDKYDEALHKALRIVDAASNMEATRQDKAYYVKELLNKDK